MSDEHTSIDGRSLDELVADMTKECDLLGELEKVEREATLRVTSCKNTVNRLQKMIDNRIKKLKEDVPYESDWGQQVRDR